MQPWHILRIIGKALLGLSIVIAVVGAGILIYARSQGLAVLSVQTGSMRPALRAGDAILIRSTGDALQLGDVVSYQSLTNPKLTITHRIVGYDISTGRVVTRGDDLQTADPAFDRDRIIGKVERRVPLAGVGFDMFRHPIGLVLAVYVPSLVLAGGEIQRLMRHYDRQHYRLWIYYG